MTVEILRGDHSALPDAERAAELLPSGCEVLSLACADPDMAHAYRVLRTVMEYGYEHERPATVRLLCADEAVYKSYRFQWNMWFAEHKPEHDHD